MENEEVLIVEKLEYKDMYPRCPKCKDGFLSPLGIKEMPKGKLSLYRCKKCGCKVGVNV